MTDRPYEELPLAPIAAEKCNHDFVIKEWQEREYLLAECRKCNEILEQVS
jgi:hypothetical protein